MRTSKYLALFSLLAALQGCDQAMMARFNGNANKAQELAMRVEGTDFEALKDLQSLAVEGNPYAAFQIGYLYHVGAGGLPKAYDISRKFYGMAAESLKSAQFNIALMDYLGEGGHKDVSKAVGRLISLTSDNGAPVESYLLLGYIYENGEGINPNLARAASLYEKAASLNNIDAATRLGVMLIEGRGRPKNAEGGLAWLRRAAENGDTNAMSRLLDFYSTPNTPNFSLFMAAQWAQILAAYNPSYKGLSDKITDSLNDAEKKNVTIMVRSWLQGHGKYHDSVDIKKPIRSLV